MRCPLRPRLLAPCLLLAGALLGGCDDLPGEAGLAPTAGPTGPVVARVAGEELRLDEVAPLARLALELRASQGLPAGELSASSIEEQVGLATELLALAAEARARSPAGRPEGRDLEEARARLAARLLLDRAMARVDARPVVEEDLVRRHAEEVQRFLANGQSPLFEPSRVDAVLVSAAPFPDQAEHPDQPPLLTREQVAALLDGLRQEVGERASDLDAFLSQAWARARGQPCLRIESAWGSPLEPSLSQLAPEVARELAGLDGQGAVSRVFWVGDTACLLRRGATRPGSGESVEAARAGLEDAIRRDRRRAAADDLRQALRRRYEVQVWPERLRSGS
ncbi:MAG TPA: hypothetical protein PK668_06320 [Myxococcota bacterium]|nr:hypothetical protein [Myxococcota bacterium]HRY92543.1 hypothetical protein [Myxococcota bacterium]HSA24656.1 hypothetical protein [Myxococcota bacterium]